MDLVNENVPQHIEFLNSITKYSEESADVNFALIYTYVYAYDILLIM